MRVPSFDAALIDLSCCPSSAKGRRSGVQIHRYVFSVAVLLVPRPLTLILRCIGLEKDAVKKQVPDLQQAHHLPAPASDSCVRPHVRSQEELARAKLQTANKKMVTVPCDECQRPAAMRCTVCSINLCTCLHSSSKLLSPPLANVVSFLRGCLQRAGSSCDSKSHATKVMQKHTRLPLTSAVATKLTAQRAEVERLEAERKQVVDKAAVDAAASAAKVAALEKAVAEAYQKGSSDKAHELEAEKRKEEAARVTREKAEAERRAKLEAEIKAAEAQAESDQKAEEAAASGSPAAAAPAPVAAAAAAPPLATVTSGAAEESDDPPPPPAPMDEDEKAAAEAEAAAAAALAAAEEAKRKAAEVCVC
jgi:hypothetical protein